MRNYKIVLRGAGMFSVCSGVTSWYGDIRSSTLLLCKTPASGVQDCSWSVSLRVQNVKYDNVAVRTHIVHSS